LGSQTGGQAKIWGDHGPPNPLLASPLLPPSVTLLAMIYCIYIYYAVPTQLQQDTSWCRSLVCGRVCKLSNWCMFWLS